jgi:RHS repeat-associated protein
MKSTLRWLFRIIAILVSTLSLHGQDQPVLDQGVKPFGSYHGGNIDQVSLPFGNLTIERALASFSQRGNQLSVDYLLRYNGKNYFVNTYCDPVTGGCNSFWDLRPGLLAAFGNPGVQILNSVWMGESSQSTVVGMVDGQPTLWTYTITITANDGAAYDFSTGVLGARSPFPGGRAGRGSQVFLAPPAGNPGAGGFYDSRGIWHTPQASFPQSPVVQDSNGNQILYVYNSGPGQSPDHFLDTMGRSLPVGLSSTTTDFTGCTGPLSINTAYVLSLPGVNGGTQDFKFCYVAPPIQTNFPGGLGDQFSANQPGSSPPLLLFLQSLVLPDGTAWTFEYNSRDAGDSTNINYGDLTKIILPTGGTLSYTWASIQFRDLNTYQNSLSLEPPARVVTSRTVNANDGNGDQTWYYNYDTSSGQQIVVTVTDPLGDRTAHTFTAMQPGSLDVQETQTQFFDNAGALLKTVATQYGGGTVVKYPTQITTTWPNGQVSQVAKAYIPLPAVEPGSVSMGSIDPGILSDEYVYDYGNGGPGPLLRHTHTDYLFQQGNSAYINLFNMIDRVSNQVTYDGSGTQVAQVTYGYDESPLSSSGVTTNFISPINGTYRGNKTSVKRWLNTTGANVTTTNQFYDTGMVSQATDPNGNTTKFSYSPNFMGAYITQTQMPDTSSAGAVVHHIISGNYDFNTGLLTTFNDQNANSTTYTYDNSWRLTAANFPDGGQTRFNYPDAHTVEKKQLQDATTNTWIDQFSYFDGLGRLKQTQLKDPQGDVFTDTTYDALGRPVTVSNPHRSAASATDGITKASYDAQGRVVSVTHPDNNTVQSLYNDPNTVTVTDETGRQRRSISDAIGQLIEVDEPGDAYAGLQAQGSIDIAQILSTQVGGHGASPATGSVTVGGSDQNKPAVPAVAGTGSVAVFGGESSYTTDPCLDAGDAWSCPQVNYDSGAVYITVNGHPNSTWYGQGSDQNTVAAGLAASINSDGSAFVAASASNGVLYLTARQAGAAGNYSWSLSAQSTSGDPMFDPNGSFANPPSSGTLSGGKDAVPTIYDSGTCSVTINSTSYSTTFGQNDMPSTIASRLGTIISSGSLANATLSGTTLSLTTKTTGVASNYSLGTSCTYNSSTFASPSFSISKSGVNLTGGTDAFGGNTVWDHGTVTMTAGGFTTAGVAYGPNTANTTGTQVAAALANALSVNGSGFTASANGATLITVTDSIYGTSGNGVQVSVHPTSADPSDFPTPSFTVSPTTLGGGANPVPGSLNSPYVTRYSYDALGNLTCVEQHGDAVSGTGCSAATSSDASSPWRVRRFTYDSLSRLLTAKNPETGTISYTYDSNGNVLTKTDARGVVVNYSPSSSPIDALNRVTANTFSDGSNHGAAFQYIYDLGTYNGISISNTVGRLIHISNNVNAASTFSYDPMGRVIRETSCIPSNCNDAANPVAAAYDLAGHLSQLTYPNGEVINYTTDSAGRTGAVQDLANNINYVTGTGGPGTLASYAPHGSLTGFLRGKSPSFGGITNSFSYNDRLQPVNMSAVSPTATVFSLNYDFHLGNGDNGNVFGITNNKDQSRNQTFTYDALNRLISAQNAGTDCTKSTVNGKTEYWGNTYGYDAWGNLLSKTVTKCSAEFLSVPALVSNQLSGYTYDAAGNMTQDPTDGVTATYDAEDRMTAATKNGVSTTYTYDAQGNRVRKDVGGNFTEYLYFGSNIIAEHDQAGNWTNYVFLNGERVARRDSSGSVDYYFSDRLKTTDIVTDSQGNIKNESDFYPWGSELQFLANDSNHYKFTGKERDAESGLDDFGARYYSSAMGRFIQPDIPFADQHRDDPQSWNLYMYGLNNPMRLVDDTGRGARPADDPRVQQVLDRNENFTISQAILRSPNYSAWALEHEMSRGASPSPSLIGVAGEAVMSDRMEAQSMFGFVTFQPRPIGGGQPDLLLTFTNEIGRSDLINIVGPDGSLGHVPMDTGPAQVYVEVKTTSNFDFIEKGAAQTAANAAAIAPGQNAAAILVVDQAAWNTLSKAQQQQLLKDVGRGFIQLQRNLIKDAVKTAIQLKQDVCTATNSCK